MLEKLDVSQEYGDGRRGTLDLSVSVVTELHPHCDRIIWLSDRLASELPSAVCLFWVSLNLFLYKVIFWPLSKFQ